MNISSGVIPQVGVPGTQVMANNMKTKQKNWKYIVRRLNRGGYVSEI
jgi:hypothetical protein